MSTRKYRKKVLIYNASIASFPIDTIRSNILLTFCSLINLKFKQFGHYINIWIETHTSEDDSVLITKYFSQHFIEGMLLKTYPAV